MHNRQSTRGGADIQMEREAAGLVRRGHDVTTMLVDNRQVESIGSVRAAGKAVWNREATRELRDRIAKFRPDVVHVQTPFPLMSPAVFRVAHGAGVAVVTTSQSFRYSCVKATMFRDGAVCEACVGLRIKTPAVVHRCYKDSLAGSATMASALAIHTGLGTFHRCIDRWIALTPFMRERIIAEGIAPDKVEVVPHTPPDPGPPRVERDGYALFVGRFIEEKGILTILRAWEQHGLDVPLHIAGDGVLRPEVEAAAARNSAITLHPWLDTDGVAALMAGAEAFLMASEWYEGFGVVITEAYAAGTPVLASDVGNFSDMIVPKVTGDQYRSGDPADLARAVRWFFDEADRPALRANARAAYDDTFHPDVQLDVLERIYAEVIAERAAAR